MGSRKATLKCIFNFNIFCVAKQVLLIFYLIKMKRGVNFVINLLSLLMLINFMRG